MSGRFFISKDEDVLALQLEEKVSMMLDLPSKIHFLQCQQKVA